MRILPKVTIIAVAIVSVITMSLSIDDSYSLSNPLEFSDIMKQKTGHTTITVSGESSTFLEPDAVVLMFRINNPPTELQNVVGDYQENITDISEEMKRELADFEDTAISYVRTEFDGDRYRYGPPANGPDSFVAYMSFPIKVDMETYQVISQEITDLGLQIDDVRITQVPVDSSEVKKKMKSQ